MRSSKSILAGIAAGALTAGLVPFALVATATSAQAATTLSVDQSIARAGVTVDDATATINNDDTAAPAVRVYVRPTADITGLSGGKVNVRIDSKPTGAGVAIGTVYQSAAIAGSVLADDSSVEVDLVGATNAATLAAFNVAGNYGVTVWVSPTGAQTVGAGDVTFLGNVILAGAPTAISFAEAAQTGPANVEDQNAVALADSAGRLTRLGTGETVPLSTAQTTGTDDTLYIDKTNPTSATTLNLGVADATAPLLSTGATFAYAVKPSAGAEGAFTTTAAGAGIGIASNPTSVFTVQPQTTAKNIDVSATNLASDWVGPVTADDTTEVRSDTTALTFTITADDTATVGDLLPITFTHSGATAVTVDGAATPSPTTLYKAIGADKKATFSVAVTGPTTSTVVTATTGAGINADLRVDWDDAAYSLTTTPATGTSLVLATGAAATIKALAADQFGNPYIGACITGSNGTVTTAVQTTGADGSVDVSIPAPATGTSATLTVTGKTQGCATNLANPYQSTISAIYGTAVVTLTGVSTTSVDETVSVPSQVTGSNNFKAITANVKVGGVNVPNDTIVTFSGSDGVRFGAGATGTWAAATATKEAKVAGGAGNVTVYMTASKAGKATVTATVAGVSQSGEVTAQVVTGTSRLVSISSPAVADAGAIVPVTVTVTDGFGNGMGGVSVDMAIPSSSIGRFANGLRQVTVTTDSTGTAVADVTSGTNESGVLAVTGTLTTVAQSADAADVPAGTGFAAGQRADSTAIEIKAGPGSKSIVIVGERGTVKDASGIIVDGATEGFDEGDTVMPFVRFPGGQYTQGTARPAIDGFGDFYWERKTGKKTYVFFTASDNIEVKSNRIIIPAK